MSLRFLCGLDLASPHVDAVARLATEWALASGARLELLHVVAKSSELDLDLDGDSSAQRAIGAVIRRRAQARAEDAMKTLARYANRAEGQGVSCAVILLEGRASDAILRRAVRADLVILGPHARSWAVGDDGSIQRWIGSVASSVVRDAPCPVLLACGVELGELPSPSLPWVLATDFQPASIDAIRAAVVLRGKGKAPFVVVHHVPSLLDEGPTEDGVDPVLFAWCDQTVQRRARTRLGLLAASEGLSSARLRVVDGPLYDSLRVVVEVHRASVLVLGDHSRAERPEPRLGSLAKRAMRESRVPVLLVRRRSAAGRAREIIPTDER